MEEQNQNTKNKDGQIPSSNSSNANLANLDRELFQKKQQLKIGRSNIDPNLQERLNQNHRIIPSLGIQQQLNENIQNEASSSNDINSVNIESEGTVEDNDKEEFNGDLSEQTPFSKSLFFFNIASNPLLKLGIAACILLVFVLFLLIIILSSKRIQDQRSTVNHYLSTGEIEEDGESDAGILENIKDQFFSTDLYDYLVQEGWCKGIFDCYTSDAANFYKMFRKKIVNVQRNNSYTNTINGCTAVGFPDSIALDVPMLTATFTYNRGDDEYLSHLEGEVYTEKLEGFKKEIEGLTNAMIGQAEDIVSQIKVTQKNSQGKITVKTISTLSQSNCTRYGLEWVSASANTYGGFCRKAKDTELPENITISKKVSKCTYVSEENYKNYIIGGGNYYLTPGTYEQGGGSTSNGNPSQTVLEYIDSISEWASQDMSTSGIYASVTIAQGILESGSGKSSLASVYHNHFGIKGKGGSCKQPRTTKKDSNGNGAWDGTSVCLCGSDGCYWYRAYTDIGASLADHSRNFWTTPTYGNHGVLECVQKNLGPEEQIRRIKAAGYAEDPDYASKIINLINTYDLKQYDIGVFDGTPPSYSSGNTTPIITDNYYTSGGYLELFRMNLLENTNAIELTKIEIYDGILKEAKETGSKFGSNSMGFDSAIVDPTGGDYNHWKQGNPAWSNVALGPKTVGEIGCASTSVAIQIARSKTQTKLSNFNPGTFAEAMSRVGGYDARGNIYWGAVSQIAPYFKFDESYSRKISGYSTNQKLEIINDLLSSGCYVIMSVKSGGHWVAVTGVTNNNIYMIDPGASNAPNVFPTYQASGVHDLRCYRKLD